MLAESRTVRHTQRAPQSCAPCAKRKVKCSKTLLSQTIPCSACIKSGTQELCRRETVAVKGQLVNVDAPATPNVLELQAEIARLKARIAELESDSEVDEEDAADPNDLDSLIQGVDLMSMGMNALPVIPAITHDNVFMIPGQPSNTPREALVGFLPARKLTEDLLEWAYKWTWWHHGAYHVPTLRGQVEAMWATDMATASWSWTGMLLAILAESLFYIDVQDAKAMGFSTDQIQTLPDIWCRAALHCILQGDVFVKHTLSSTQTIIILCGIVNALGHSSLHTTLLPLGIAISTSLKLNKLGMEPTCQLHDAGTLCVVHGIAGPHIACDWDFILRESGRRVWTTLQYHDRLSWQARQNRGSALRGNSVPHNLDDVEIGQVAIVRPKSEATMVSHLLSMADCAATVHSFLSSKLDSMTALAKVDFQLQALLDTPWYRTETYEHIAWARHIWILCIQHKRLVSHRPYFAKSIRQPRFLAARQTCVQAATAILCERRKVLPPTYEKNWIVMFDTLSAAVVLAIDFFHSPVTGDNTRRADIYELLNALTRGLPQNAYVQRAAGLLLALLAEEDKLRASYTGQVLQSPIAAVHPFGNDPFLSPSDPPLEPDVDWEIWKWLEPHVREDAIAPVSLSPQVDHVRDAVQAFL